MRELVMISSAPRSGEKVVIEAILENMADGVIAVDRSGSVVVFNRAATKVTLYSEKEALGASFSRIFTTRSGGRGCSLSRALETGEVQIDHNCDLITKTGEAVPISITCTPLLDVDGSVAGCIAVFRDMAEFRQIDDMKTEFVSTVSHELRTPLTSIKGSIGLILGGVAGQINEDVTELLGIAQNNTDRLIKLINDMLDVSKIESGKIQMNREPIFITDCVRRSVEGIRSVAQENGVKLIVDLPPSVSTVHADRDRIVQVITNLLSNAIKYTPPDGSVTVSVAEEPDYIQLSVKDTGIGIPENQLDKIFDKFHQVERSSTRQKSGGTGLGLSICYAIIAEHEGKTWVESQVGQGSTFFFTLPKAKTMIEDLWDRTLTSVDDRISDLFSRRARAEVIEVKGKTILICDDDPGAVRELRSYLEKQGFNCIEAFNGKEAIEIAHRIRPDAITMDIIMPSLDGFQVVSMLKEDAVTEKIPIVFVSVLKDKSHKEISMGFHDWIVKPINEDRLVGAVKSAVGQKKEQPYLLIVDDDPDVVRLLKIMVDRAGYLSEVAYDGKEAIEKINSCKPDLIILDIMMPALDGFQVVNLLKENNWTKDIPVLILTAKDLTPLEKKMLHLGATKILMKSCASQEVIMQDVSELLRSAISP